MKLEVDKEYSTTPCQFKIYNAELDTDRGGFSDSYVAISGFFGPYNPELFAAAPELLETVRHLMYHLEQVGDCRSSQAILDAERVIAKAEGDIQ